MAAITILCKQDSPRLRYVLDWIFKHVMHITYLLESDVENLSECEACIAYGEVYENAYITLPDAGLLWEKAIQQHSIPTGNWNNIPTLYHQADSAATVPFDLFSAIFFLLSRYEEYYPHTPDKHGRYPATESILYKNNWLLRPLIDEWIYAFYLMLKEKGVPAQLSGFRFVPTYDIDMAYSFKHKGTRRNIGGFLRSILKGDKKEIILRQRVLASRALDPYDSFVFIKGLHAQYHVHPIYFMLVALQTTAYDKNIHPETSVMQRLIRRLKHEGSIGLHPSYYSDKEKTFQEEATLLKQTVGENITQSRQHYLRFTVPKTYPYLIKQGVAHDYSMGYGSALGFRCATGRSFYWYDISKEIAAPLIVHPFCFMDATAHYEAKLSTQESLETLLGMMHILKRTESQMVTVFHNFSLGTDTAWKGWDTLYETFIKACIAHRNH